MPSFIPALLDEIPAPLLTLIKKGALKESRSILSIFLF